MFHTSNVVSTVWSRRSTGAQGFWSLYNFFTSKTQLKTQSAAHIGVKTLDSVSLDAVLFVEILGLSIAYDGYGIPTHFKMLSLMVYEFTRRTGHMEPFHIKNTTQKKHSSS